VWDVYDWRGWALVPLFVIARVVGKYTGVFAARTVVGGQLPAAFTDQQRQLVSPMSGLSIALVISVGSLYPEAGLRWVMTAVIGGAIVTEVLVALTSLPPPVEPPPPPPAIDELDEPADTQGGHP
jgi:hypothetical protein